MMMLQTPDPFVPTVPANPEDAMDVKGFMDSMLADITAGAAPEFLDTGMLLWRGMAAILIVWTGVRIAFEGDPRPWDLIRLVFALSIPWSMLTLYTTPMPGTSLTFPGTVIEGGNWIQRTLIGDIASDWMDAYVGLAQNMFNRGTGTDPAAACSG